MSKELGIDVSGIKGVVFDLDGTLVDSRLDFDAIRAELDFPQGRPILEDPSCSSRNSTSPYIRSATKLLLIC